MGVGYTDWRHALRAMLLVLLFAAGPNAQAACVNPETLANTTVSLTRHFGGEERAKDPTLVGIRGTAWFLSPRLLVTAGHVALSMGLSNHDWKQIEINSEGTRHSDLVRLQRLAGEGREKIAVLEIQEPVPAAKALRLRTEPLVLGEAVASIAYPGDHLRFASGRFVRQGEGHRLAGSALFELADGDDRLALDHGASGAPVIDCEGRAVAVVTNVITKTMAFMSQAIRVSTSWGNPNVAAVSISALGDVSNAE